MSTLHVRNLHAGYNGSQVLRGVDLRVAPGEIVCLLGRNGAGRSTLARAVMGLVPASGTMRYGQVDLLGLPTHKVARTGIAYVPEGRDVFPGMRVQDNLRMGIRTRGRTASLLDRAYQLFPVLAQRRDVMAGNLSGGEQQMLSLARALMGEPGLMIVDEPTEGLSPQMVAVVSQYLEEIRKMGVAILLIEQKQQIALQVADRAYVLGQGRVVCEGSPSQCLTGTVVSAWLEI